MKNLYILLLFPLLYYYGCTGGCSSYCTADCKELICGKYYYTISDSLDNKLIDGVINFSDCDGNKIGGTYSKDKIYNDNFPGFSSLKGFFNGNADVKEKKAFINLNPLIADNNIFVNLEVNQNNLKGKWVFSTLRGKSGAGNFSAVKVK